MQVHTYAHVAGHFVGESYAAVAEVGAERVVLDGGACFASARDRAGIADFAGDIDNVVVNVGKLCVGEQGNRECVDVGGLGGGEVGGDGGDDVGDGEHGVFPFGVSCPDKNHYATGLVSGQDKK